MKTRTQESGGKHRADLRYRVEEARMEDLNRYVREGNLIVSNVKKGGSARSEDTEIRQQQDISEKR